MQKKGAVNNITGDNAFLQIIGHRGVPCLAPENTLSSFRHAVSMNLTHAECDVRMTVDGQLVLMHDATVNRTTDGRGRVSRLSLSEIKQLDCGSWFDREFAGEEVPTLQQLFDAISGKLHAVVEIKEVCRQDLATKAVVGLIQKLNLTRMVSLTSFYWPVLIRAKQIEPDIETQALVILQKDNAGQNRQQSGLIKYRDIEELLADERLRWADMVCPNADAVDESVVNRLQQEGFLVRVWGAHTDCRHELCRLMRCGIDGMTADHPGFVKSVWEDFKAQTS